ncbi:hypothetical protein L0665_07845 [Methanogenium marinum]|uniref:Uncharacterized protein n=1 Tax=Methanogenium marinum TaxID=348610 RepID=A0A9Q4PYR9_9EURY|nr:hypothetical protein [Methanogenium marinum]MDE4908517.1 hypothetical protein [Methanogenium marinum]
MSDLWIDDSDDGGDEDEHPDPADVCTSSTALHSRNGNITDSQNAQNDVYSSKKVQYGEICTDSKRSLHVFGETHSTPDGGDDSGRDFCESGMGANKESIYKCNEQLAFRDSKNDIYSCKAENKAKKHMKRCKQIARRES